MVLCDTYFLIELIAKPSFSVIMIEFGCSKTLSTLLLDDITPKSTASLCLSKQFRKLIEKMKLQLY
nr:hypothetical protein [Mycoplasmopsis bovis]